MTRLEWRRIAAEAQRLAQNSQLVEAIKLLRAKTGCGLSEAYHAAIELRDLVGIEDAR